MLQDVIAALRHGDGERVMSVVGACESGRHHAWWTYLPASRVRSWGVLSLHEQCISAGAPLSGLASAKALGLLFMGNCANPPVVMLGPHPMRVTRQFGTEVRTHWHTTGMGACSNCTGY